MLPYYNPTYVTLVSVLFAAAGDDPLQEEDLLVFVGELEGFISLRKVPG